MKTAKYYTYFSFRSSSKVIDRVVAVLFMPVSVSTFRQVQ